MLAITDKISFNLPDFMATPSNRKSENRPRPLHISKSFTRAEPTSQDLSTRAQRASTIQNGVIPEVVMAKSSTASAEEKPRKQPDVFERISEDGGSSGGVGKLPDDFDELPIELASLCDRYELQPTP